MTFLEIARRWTLVILAEALKTTTDVIAAVLPFQPRWLAQIALLAEHMRLVSEGTFETEEGGEAGEAEMPTLDALLHSHARLHRAVSDIGIRGLALDPELMQRMRTDWNVESVVSYMSTAEKNLQDAANRALREAAEPLGISIAAMPELAADASGAASPAVPAKPASRPARRRATAR